MRNTSLGLIETWGWVPAIVAADAASKAAMVSLLGYEPARAGLVTVKMVGDVAAVQAAVAAGAAAAARVGKVMAVHVIPRPDRQVWTTQAGPEGAPRVAETEPASGAGDAGESGAKGLATPGENDASRVPKPPGESESPGGPEKSKKRSSKASKPAKAEKLKPKGRGKREG